jgi:hypothetical protein
MPIIFFIVSSPFFMNGLSFCILTPEAKQLRGRELIPVISGSKFP